ncbi:cold-shock protein [Rhizobium halophytocola]|uniref:Cold-shock protein n=1 Tax=Rhizobium halophytocola TaxID=735519 RepID=A0ABS4E5W0_9HYPH|nr:cold-shock protein [Rhizobium halophytocola]MBP1853331.1 hypothetical protein [Rhizobium halophytocola]
MSSQTYVSGDAVVLKSGTFRQPGLARTCRITAVLPEQRGAVQYRVRFGDENFERRIDGDDIEAQVSEEDAAALERSATPSEEGARDRAAPWVTPVAIKARR